MKKKYLKWVGYILVLVVLGAVLMFAGNKPESDEPERKSEISDVFSEEAEEETQAQENVKNDDSEVNSSESSEKGQNSETTPEVGKTMEDEDLIVEDNKNSGETSVQDQTSETEKDTEKDSTTIPQEPSSREWSRDY